MINIGGNNIRRMVSNLKKTIQHIGWALGQIFRAAPILASIVSIISIAEGAAPAALVYITQHLIDLTIASFGHGMSQLHKFVPWIGAMFFCSLLSFEVMYKIRDPILLRIKQKLNYELGGRRLKIAAELPLITMEQSETTNMLDRSDNPGGKLDHIFHHLLWSLQGIVQLVTISLFFAAITPWLPPVLLLILLPAILLASKAQQLWLDVTYEQTEEQRKADYVDSLLTGRKEQKELRLLNLRGEFQRRWWEQRSYIRSASLNVRRRIAILEFPGSLVDNAATAFIMVYAAYQLANRDISVGFFVAVFQAVHIYSQAYDSVAYGIRESLQGSGEVGFVRELFGRGEASSQASSDTAPASGSKPLSFPRPFQSSIEMKRVTFAYEGREPVLQGVSFHIRPGEHVALVGVNGAGKSTIVKLLTGLYTPGEGKISADGIDYSAIERDSLRDNITAAFQDYYNFEFTLAQSIGLGDPAQTEVDGSPAISAIEAAAAMGGADQVLGQMERGWQQPIGHVLDGGVGLSGGQWQRIALSRALMRESQLLVLDEPTAALDPKVEAELYARFTSIMRDRSVFIVSHRLGSARIADRILVLSNGIIVEEGSHDQLLSAEGEYTRMWEEQAQWYKD